MKILTFDIEEYFHLLDVDIARNKLPDYSVVESITGNILQLLKENNVHAIFFVVGEVAKKHPELVERIAQDGHLVGSHSMRHRLHSDLTDLEFKQDLLESLDVLQNILGYRPKLYRAPGFSLTEKYAHRYTILSECGIDSDFSIFLNGGSHGGVHERNLPERTEGNFYFTLGSIKSYPFVKSNFLGVKVPLLGGGYFRLFPLFFLLRGLKKSEYSMTYFHPRDFDPFQPVIPRLGLIRTFKSYVGLKTSFRKLERLVREIDWGMPDDLEPRA
jgi:polysaccharide deacetylase family protein (PEP-CTERM system associated)